MFGFLLGTPSNLVAKGRELVDQGAILLDVRSPEEFASGHVEGAKNIPLQTLAHRFHELGEDKDAPIVVHCHSGGRSRAATRMLHQLGFRNVVDIGGMPNW